MFERCQGKKIESQYKREKKLKEGKLKNFN